MKSSNVLSPQNLAFQLALAGFLVIAIALHGIATSDGPAREKPLLTLTLIGAVIAIRAASALRRRWNRESDSALPQEAATQNRVTGGQAVFGVAEAPNEPGGVLLLPLTRDSGARRRQASWDRSTRHVHALGAGTRHGERVCGAAAVRAR
jgi:hypothetical protein